MLPHGQHRTSAELMLITSELQDSTSFELGESTVAIIMLSDIV